MQFIEIGAHFPAKWQGYCAWCGEMFSPNDELTFVDNEVVCLACAEEAREHNVWQLLIDLLGGSSALPTRATLALPRVAV